MEPKDSSYLGHKRIIGVLLFFICVLVLSHIAFLTYNNHDPSITSHPEIHRQLNNFRLVKTASEPNVYYVDQYQVRHIFPDFETFKAHGHSIRHISVVTNEEMNSFTLGYEVPTVIPFKPTIKCPCTSASQLNSIPETFRTNTTFEEMKDTYIKDVSNQVPKKVDLCLIESPLSKQFLKEFGSFFEDTDVSRSNARYKLLQDQLHLTQFSFREIPAGAYAYEFYQKIVSLTPDTTVYQDLVSCHVIIDFVSPPEGQSVPKYACPELCVPRPYLKLPYPQLQIFLSLVTELLETRDIPTAMLKMERRIYDTLTCSMTWETLLTSPAMKTFLTLLHPTSTSSSNSNTNRKPGQKVHSKVTPHSVLTTSSTTSFGGTATTIHLDTTSYLQRTIIHYFLQQLVTRRDEECFEPADWNRKIATHAWLALHPETIANNASGHLPDSLYVHHSQRTTKNTNPWFALPESTSINAKRDVFGLVIWIGSRSRVQLLYDQIEVLRVQYTAKEGYHGQGQAQGEIAGWMSSEDQYPCRAGSTTCKQASSTNRLYYAHMPDSIMHFTNTGWSCAQRRPLRSLAHVLLLYSSHYILLADDDTYVNIQILLHKSFQVFIMSQFLTSNIIYGSVGGSGLMTNAGFFFGGGGYLFSETVMSQLNDYYLYGPKVASNDIITPRQMNDLALLYQTMILSKQYCSKEYACVESLTNMLNTNSNNTDNTNDNTNNNINNNINNRVETNTNSAPHRQLWTDAEAAAEKEEEALEEAALKAGEALPAAGAKHTEKSVKQELSDQTSSRRRQSPSFRRQLDETASVGVAEGVTATTTPGNVNNGETTPWKQDSTRGSPKNGVWSGEIGYDSLLTIRLVDLCLNLMSDENTCYHSDHALSRCFFYGIFAKPRNVLCQGERIDNSTELSFGMCFDTSNCSASTQLTCHRWKANPLDVLEPIPTGLQVKVEY